MSDPVFDWPLRVYWEDTDAGGVVFHANHLKFFERARTEWLRALGLGQQALREATGAIFIVGETQVRYLAPARLDDALRITVQPVEVGRASMVLQQQAWLATPTNGHRPAEATGAADANAALPPRLLCEGRIRIGCVDAGTFRPRRFPTAIVDALGR